MTALKGNVTASVLSSGPGTAHLQLLDVAAGGADAAVLNASVASPAPLGLTGFSGVSVTAADFSVALPSYSRCLAGTFYNSTAQACTTCPEGLIADEPGMSACKACPSRNAWVDSATCVQCPPNSVTSPYSVSQCACIASFYDQLFGASLTAPVCAVCPIGAECSTGFVGAAAGYWRENTASSVFLLCKQRRCLPEAINGPLGASSPLLVSGGSGTAAVKSTGRGLLQTSVNQAYSVDVPSTSDSPVNCLAGHTGPLCGACMPGFSMQSSLCMPCDPAAAWTNWSDAGKAGMLVGCIIFAFIAIMLVFFQPLLMPLERFVERASGWYDSLIARVSNWLTSV